MALSASNTAVDTLGTAVDTLGTDGILLYLAVALAAGRLAALARVTAKTH